ncbi:GerMN domain-containing protein [Petrocella sp. FN5]|uniref:GerMN domain-containing protein n=1 Tax=Petrocella sp. FN5 TaxID=3032002 RepID=UPI0023D98D32|nr:GerMN domain-containing protein [Petrocella sp. FN5]MDF1616571.1 GerMN domain-containing protein [Petrocella sp. FN5]
MRRVLVAVILLVLIFASCKPEVEEVTIEENREVLLAYLVNGEKDELVAYEVEVHTNDLTNQIEHVLDVLSTGVITQKLLPTIPKDLTINQLEISEGNIIVHMPNDIKDMEQIDFLLCRTSLIRSLTSIEAVVSIEFYVDGLPLKDSNGKVYGPFFKSDVIVNMESENEVVKSIHLNLYFPEQKGEFLIKVNREVGIKSNESIEERIIKELMLPPEGHNLMSLIPQETVVKSIYVDQGICYIDFNEAFRTEHIGGSTSEVMSIYAIVNSLTDLPNINKVQFLIEGKKSESFTGHLQFDILFEQSLDLVSKESKIKD